MRAKKFFILGTDTEVGKTTVSRALLSGLKVCGFSTIGLKPIASGAQWTAEGLRNDDALFLQESASIWLPYDQINPFCFKDPIAPHIAANYENIFLSASTVSKSCQLALNCLADYYVIEGLGGVCVPLNKRETFVDLICKMNLPVMLVVGLRLGCLNQAVLTWSCLKQQDIHIIGWIANQVEANMTHMKENIKFLQSFFDAPCLGFFPYKREIELDFFCNLIDYEALFDALDSIYINNFT